MHKQKNITYIKEKKTVRAHHPTEPAVARGLIHRSNCDVLLLFACKIYPLPSYIKIFIIIFVINIKIFVFLMTHVLLRMHAVDIEAGAINCESCEVIKTYSNCGYPYVTNQMIGMTNVCCSF